MDSDDGLQLNLAGFEASAGNGDRKPKTNRHTVSFRKQQKKQKQNRRQGRTDNGPREVQQQAAPLRPASVLKGYDLDSAASNLAAAQALPKAEAAQGRAGNKPHLHKAAHGSALSSSVPQIAPPAIVKPLNNTFEKLAKIGKRDRAAFEDGWHEVVYKSDEEDMDIMDAVNAIRQTEAQLQAELPEAADANTGHVASFEDEDEEEEDDEERPAGVVSFVPHSANKYPKAKKPRPEVPTDTKGRSPKEKAKAPLVARTLVKAGELVHVATDVPLAAQHDMFGGVDTSSFQGLGLAPVLCEHLEAMNFSAPTRIQQATIPILLAGRDALAKAPTGSGKTLAYLAGIIHDLQGQEPHLSRAEGTYAIIMAPTRELCIQICDVLTLILRRFFWLVGGSILGGEQRNKEKARLRKGITVLVASPGRLLDHLQKTEAFKTDELRWLVLDEADRLLDMGFQQKLEEIIGILDRRTEAAGNRQRQTVLLSATLHSNLGTLASLSLTNPVSVGIRAAIVDGQVQVEGAAGTALAGSSDAPQPAGSDFEVPAQLRQQYIEVPERLRLVALAAVVRSQCGVSRGPQGAKGVVFLSSRAGVDFHYAVLGRVYEGMMDEPLLPGPLFRLHGSLSQAERTKTFLEFSRSPSGLLLCTDVAARGLDFTGVSVIIQFDPPGEPTEYVHRVGRTARMGQQGQAMLFLLPSEKGYIQKLQQHGVKVQQGNLMQHILQLQELGTAPVQHKKGQPIEDHPVVLDLQRQFMTKVSESSEVTQLAEDAFRSFTRAYAAHPSSIKDIFHVKQLHLGHMAHSFALRSKPSMIGQNAPRSRKWQQASRGKTR